MTRKKKNPKKKTARKATKKQVDVARLGESAALKVAKLPDTSKTDLKKLAGRFDRVDRALAKRDDLSATLLETLSHSSDRITRRNVTANPNCGPKTLLHLAPQFPAEFLANPQFDWMLIENPSRFHKLDKNVLMGMFKRQDCPEAFLRWAADHKSDEVKLALISNKQAPKDILERFARSRNKRTAEAAKAHEKLAGEISEDELDKVFFNAVRELLAGDVKEERRLKYIGLAQFPYVSVATRLNFASLREVPEDEALCRRTSQPKEIRRLANSAWVQDWIRAARSPRCPPDLLKILAQARDADDREKVDLLSSIAANTNCPPDLLEELASINWSIWFAHDWICSFVAANPNCPAELLAELAGRKDRWIRGGVAANPKCSADLLQKMARNRDPWVRSSVAANPNCPATTQARIIKGLAKNKDKFARSCAAENPKCPVDLLEILAKDDTRLWVQFFRGGGFEPMDIRGNVAANPNCPADLLIELAKARDPRVRGNVAVNPNCPADLLSRLVKDNDPGVRRRVAELKNCPLEVLARLLNDSNWLVLQAAISNERCTENLRKKAMQRIQTEGSSSLRKSAAEYWGNGFMRSRNLVKALSADEKPVVRKALAGNPKCPSRLYEVLLEDNDDAVRLAAARNASHPANVHLICEKPASSPWFQLQLAKAEAKFPGTTAAVQEGNMLFRAPKTGKALRSTSLIGRIIALSQPDTPPAELARASGYRDWRQRMAIARNPATPPTILEKLSKDSNRYVATQASAILHRDEKKSRALALRIKAGTTSKTIDVDYKQLSQWIGERVRDEGSSGVLDVIPTDFLDGHIEAWAAYLPPFAWWNPNSLTVAKIQQAWDQQYGKLAPSLVELLSDRSKVSDVDWLLKLARSRHCPKELLKSLGACRDVAVRQAAAENSNCPAKLLALLSNDRSRNVRLAIASNPKCPATLLANQLKTLAASKDFEVRQQVAENPKCPTDLLEKLAEDESEWVRSRVAANPKCPTDLLEKLTADKDDSVREVVADNPKCPASLLDKLATDQDEWVRYNLAKNPNCSADALEKLATDKNVSVREAVAEHPKCPADLFEKLASDKNEGVRWSVAINPKCPADLLAKLATDKKASVRAAVAGNRKCLADLVTKLATDKTSRVREGAAGNTICPADLLAKLATDRDSEVRKSVAENSTCPAGLLEKLATDQIDEVRESVAGNPKCPVGLLAELANDKEAWVRKLVAENPKCPASLLTQLALDKAREVRWTVAKNPRCPAGILTELATVFEDKDVRERAKAELARRRENA